MIRNPFQYGRIVGPDAFCNRRREIADLMTAMANGDRIFLFSERRMGKTSLVKRSMDRLSSRQFVKVYVDLWPTDGPRSFIRTLAKGLAQAMGDQSELLPELEDVLTAPSRIARETGKQVVIVMDEFQRILEYEDDLVERTLRSMIQEQFDVAYVFLGSRRHLIEKMLLDQDHPLFRAGGHYPLGPIEVQHWRPFIRKRFVEHGKFVSERMIESLCEMTAGHPFYTQQLSHAVWEICDVEKEANENTLEAAVDLLLQRESHAYSAIWDSLTLNQRRFLVGLAISSPRPAVMSAEFLRPAGLSSASSVQRVISRLQERSLVDRDNGSYQIADRFFALWIRREARR